MDDAPNSTPSNDTTVRSTDKYRDDNPQAPDKTETPPSGKQHKDCAKNVRQRPPASRSKVAKHKPRPAGASRPKRRAAKASSKSSDDDAPSSQSSQLDESAPKASPEPAANTEDQIDQNKLVLVLLGTIVGQVEEFSTDKVIDYVQAADESDSLGDPLKCKQLFNDFKARLVDSSPGMPAEHACKREVLESFHVEAKATFPDRLRVYNSLSESALATEQQYTHDLIDSYLRLTEPADADSQQCEFDRLCRVNAEFFDYLRREDQRSAVGQPSDSPRQHEDDVTASIYEKLQHNEAARLRRLGAVIDEADPRTAAWSEVETANLLRGVFRYGEQHWRSILNDEQFNRSRTTNQLALKWRTVKIFMKGELDALNVKRQKLVTKDDWMLAVIKGLEKKNGVFRDLPTSHVAGLSKYTDRPGDDFDGSDSKPSKRQSSNGKHERIPAHLLQNALLPDSHDKASDDDESECPDFFTNVSLKKAEHLGQMPPQNYIVPKLRSRHKSLSGLARKRRAEAKEAKPGLNIELV